MQALIDQLADIERDDHVRITLSDDTTISGRVSPMEYTPEDHLRFEIRPDGDPDVRFEIESSYENDDWTPVRANRITSDEKERESLGDVTSVNVEYREGQTDHERQQSDVRL